MSNKVNEVLQTIGLSPLQTFEVSEWGGKLYRVTETLKIQVRNGDVNSWRNSNHSFADLLQDGLTILVDPFEPLNSTELLACAYALACGCKWLAADDDGSIWAYECKPTFSNGYWHPETGTNHFELKLDIPFVLANRSEVHYINKNVIDQFFNKAVEHGNDSSDIQYC